MNSSMNPYMTFMRGHPNTKSVNILKKEKILKVQSRNSLILCGVLGPWWWKKFNESMTNCVQTFLFPTALHTQDSSNNLAG